MKHRYLLLIILFFFMVHYITAQSNNQMVLQRGHTFDIICLAASPDGKIIASGAADRTVKLWTRDARLIRTLSGHRDTISKISFSADSKYLLSSSADGTFKIWRMEDGKLLNTVYAHTESVSGAFFYGEENYIISYGIHTSRFMNEAGAEIKKWTFSGDLLKEYRIWDQQYFEDFTISPQGIIAAKLQYKEEIILWKADDLSFIQYINIPGINWPSFTFAADGNNLIICTIQENVPTLIFWHLEKGEQKRLTLPGNTINGLISISADNKYLLGTGNNRFFVFDLQSLSQIISIDIEFMTAFCFVPYHHSIIISDYTGLHFYSFQGQREYTIPTKIFIDSQVVVDPESRYLAHLNNYYDRVFINIWNMEGTFINKIHQGLDYGTNLAISPMGESLVVGMNHGFMVMGADGLNTKTVRTEAKTLAQFLEEDSILAVDEHGSVKLWDTKGNLLKQLNNSVGSDIQCMQLSADKKLLAAGGREGRVILYSIEQEKIIKAFYVGDQDVMALSLSPDSMSILVSVVEDIFADSYANNMSLWSTGGELLATFYHANINCVAFNPQGDLLASGSDNNEIRLWNKDGELLKILSGHTNQVQNLCFTNDGGKLVSSAADTSVKIWDLETYENLTLFENDDEWVIYTRDGYFDSSPNGGRLLNMTAGIVTYGIDQFALSYNRPDIILSRFEPDKNEAISSYFGQYIKRIIKAGLLPEFIDKNTFENGILSKIQRPPDKIFFAKCYQEGSMGYSLNPELSMLDKYKLFTFSEYTELVEQRLVFDNNIPTIEIISKKQNGKYIDLTFNASDSKYDLLSYNIYINDVPLFGQGGKKIIGKKAVILERLELSSGRNKIEASCYNQRMAESYRVMFYADYEKQIKGDLYFLGFGVSSYKNPEYNLVYPRKDVQDLSALFNSMQDLFNNIHIQTYVDDQCTVANIKQAKNCLTQAEVDDTVVLFISGHGTHSTDWQEIYYFLTWETDVYNLAQTAAPFTLIEDILDGIKPRNKLFLMDTCESGDISESSLERFLSHKQSLKFKPRTIRGLEIIDEQEQIKPRTYLFKKNRYIFNDLFRRTGAIVFSSSAGGEFSYEPLEYDETENGFFTGAVISSFKDISADVNKDGMISVYEMRNYVIHHVARRSEGLQNPTVDRDNIYQNYAFPTVDTIIPADITTEELNAYLLMAVKSQNIKLAHSLLQQGANPDTAEADGKNVLMIACQAGTIELVELLIENGADVNARDSKNTSVAHWAYSSENGELLRYIIEAGALIPAELLIEQAEKNNMEKLKWLLQSGADINLQDNKGNTTLTVALNNGFVDMALYLINKGANLNLGAELKPLHYAVKNGSKDILEVLIDKGADLETRDKEGKTPLIMAAQTGQKLLAEILIKAGADINARDEKGRTPLIQACDQGHLELVQLLIQKKADLNLLAKDVWGNLCSALITASENKHRDIVKLLLANGADPNIGFGFYGDTILIIESERGDTELVELLLTAGAQVNKIIKSSVTALIMAARNGHMSVAEKLIQAGADPNIRPDTTAYYPALLEATVGNHLEIVKLLLANKADVNITAKYGETALIEATKKNNMDIVQLLLSAGADPDAVTESSSTFAALIEAAEMGHKEIAEILIAAGADLGVRAYNGETALIKAVEKDQTEILKLLIEAGADVNATNRFGQTALFLARREQKREIVKILLEAGAEEE